MESMISRAIEPVDIKSAATPDRSLLRGLRFWKKYQPDAGALLLYQGKNLSAEGDDIQFNSWEEIDSLQ